MRRAKSTLENLGFEAVVAWGGDRGRFIFDAVPQGTGKVLDVGCAFGWALGDLRGKASELHGIDLDDAALERARESYPEVSFRLASATDIPFGDQTFDAVICSEVIEHVGDANKAKLVSEIARVLKPGGVLVFTAPHAGLLAWADPMDFKRRFTWLYRMYMRLSGYKPVDDLVAGHKHVSYREVLDYFGQSFEVEIVRFTGLLEPFLSWILVVAERLRLLPRSVTTALNRFRAWESGIPCGKHMANSLRLRARRS